MSNTNLISFYLIRHGQKEKTMGDPGLTDLGKEQARLIGKFLKGLGIDKIITSPIKRAKETANIIADISGKEVVMDDLIKERVNWGNDPNQSIEDFLEMWTKASLNRKWNPPVGDSSIEAGNRMLLLMNNIIESGDSNENLIISHGGIIVDCLLNLFTENYLNSFIPDFVQNRDAKLSECSITKLNYDKVSKKFSVEYLASVDHLK